MRSHVRYETEGSVAVLTIDRPEQRNAINAAVAEDLRAAVTRFEADTGARVGILAGAGGVFCAGMDLKAFLGGEAEAILFGKNRFAGFVVAQRTKPIIAAVQGAALAGGFEIALACDLIVAEEGAVFGLPEVGVGIFAVAGGPFRLARRIPPAKALELALTAGRMDAAEAHALGLVNRIADKGGVLDAARALAAEIARNAPLGVTATLRLCRAAERQRESELFDYSEELWQAVAASHDAHEGPQAFIEKRTPEWAGK